LDAHTADLLNKFALRNNGRLVRDILYVCNVITLLDPLFLCKPGESQSKVVRTTDELGNCLITAVQLGCILRDGRATCDELAEDKLASNSNTAQIRKSVGSLSRGPTSLPESDHKFRVFWDDSEDDEALNT
jgi:hypothetical protein